VYPERTDLHLSDSVLCRFDWVDCYPVHRHITCVDELMSYTTRYQNRVPHCDRVFLATAHKDACAFGDERLMFPFMRVIGTSLARCMFYVEHHVTRNTIIRTEYGVRASLFITYYGIHSICLAVAETSYFERR